jgi:hypothetical protein
MLSVIFELWLLFVCIYIAGTLLVALITSGGGGAALGPYRPPNFYSTENLAAARAALKPQRTVFWWLPHDQGP